MLHDNLLALSDYLFNIVNVEGKKKKLGKFEGKKPNRKKAIVTLKKGEKLDIFEGG